MFLGFAELLYNSWWISHSIPFALILRYRDKNNETYSLIGGERRVINNPCSHVFLTVKLSFWRPRSSKNVCSLLGKILLNILILDFSLLKWKILVCIKFFSVKIVYVRVSCVSLIHGNFFLQSFISNSFPYEIIFSHIYNLRGGCKTKTKWRAIISYLVTNGIITIFKSTLFQLANCIYHRQV